MAAHMMMLVRRRALRRERIFRDRLHPLDEYNDKEMFKKYRFTREGVIQIIELLQGELQHETMRSNALPASLQVFVALRFYGSGSVMDATSTIHGISNATTSRTVRRVSKLLCQKRDRVGPVTFFIFIN